MLALTLPKAMILRRNSIEDQAQAPVPLPVAAAMLAPQAVASVTAVAHISAVWVRVSVRHTTSGAKELAPNSASVWVSRITTSTSDYAQQQFPTGHYGGGIGGGGLGGGGLSTGVGSHAASPHVAAGYAYEGHPYEYAGGNHHGGYYGGNSAEAGINFDVYGARPSHGSHHAHYGYTGGEYAYVEPHDLASHKGPPELSHKALLAKSFLIPLASAAVLGIAAALVSNPLLLQLGTVSGVGGGLGPVVGKRKRRALRLAFAAHKQ